MALRFINRCMSFFAFSFWFNDALIIVLIMGAVERFYFFLSYLHSSSLLGPFTSLLHFRLISGSVRTNVQTYGFVH
jgi:hypothetical protein